MKELRDKAFLSRYGVLLASLLLGIFFSLSSGVFLNWQNLNVIAIGRVLVGLFGLASLVPLVVGEFDISLGYMMGFITMFGAKIGMYTDSPLLIILAMLLAGIVLGSLNGFITVMVKVSSTISTLAMGSIFYGATLCLNRGRSITGTIPLSMIKAIKTKILNFNLSVWIFLFFAMVLIYLLEHTPFGKQIYAVGMSQKVSYLSGIRTGLVRFMSFVLAGFYVSIGALILLSQSGNAYPDTGPSYLMPGLAAVFFSITTHMPSRFNVPGLLASLLMLGIVFNGISLLGSPFWVESVVNGLILVTIVLITNLILKRESKKKEERLKALA